MQALAVGIPFILNYLVICETGIKIHHYKVVWVALFSLLPQLFISFCVDVNVVMTFYQRSWGGARVEAAADKALDSIRSKAKDVLTDKIDSITKGTAADSLKKKAQEILDNKAKSEVDKIKEKLKDFDPFKKKGKGGGALPGAQ